MKLQEVLEIAKGTNKRFKRSIHTLDFHIDLDDIKCPMSYIYSFTVTDLLADDWEVSDE